MQVQVHLFPLTQLQCNNKKKKRSKNRGKYTLNLQRKKCVAAKGAKLSSWLLPQSGYKWVEVI